MLNLKESALQMLDYLFQVETYEGQATLSYSHGLTPISPLGFDVLWPNLYGKANKYLTMSEAQAVKPPYLRWHNNHAPASKKGGGRIYVSLQTPLATGGFGAWVLAHRGCRVKAAKAAAARQPWPVAADQHRTVYSLETETGKTKNCRDHGERNVEGVS